MFLWNSSFRDENPYCSGAIQQREKEREQKIQLQWLFTHRAVQSVSHSSQQPGAQCPPTTGRRPPPSPGRLSVDHLSFLALFISCLPPIPPFPATKSGLATMYGITRSLRATPVSALRAATVSILLV